MQLSARCVCQELGKSGKKKKQNKSLHKAIVGVVSFREDLGEGKMMFWQWQMC